MEVGDTFHTNSSDESGNSDVLLLDRRYFGGGTVNVRKISWSLILMLIDTSRV